MNNLTSEQIINWLASNLSTLGMAELLDAIDTAGNRAVEMVLNNPRLDMSTDELIFDEFWYTLRDSAPALENIETWEEHVADGSGIVEWVAVRTGHSSMNRCHRRETEIQAIVALLRWEDEQVEKHAAQMRKKREQK